jgi:hypothetical protein
LARRRGDQILGGNGFDIGALRHIGASADGSPVEGYALDHGIDPLAMREP